MMRLALVWMLLVASCAVAQRPEVAIPVGVRFAATEANAPPGTCGCFWLTGGAVDAALPLLPSLSVAVEAAGSHAATVPGTGHAVSEVTLLAGPRAGVRLGRLNVAAQGLFGAAHGFDAPFQMGTVATTSNATGFAFAVGGFAEVRLTRRVWLRAVQVDYLQTNLLNGVDNRQRNVRVGAGITFRVPLPGGR